MSATIATVLGTLAAITLVRLGRFRGRTLFSGMIFAPLVMPDVIIGLSLLLLFVAIGLDRGFWTITLAHITFTMCLRGRRRAGAAAGLRQVRRGSGDGSRCDAAQHLLPGDAADHRAVRRVSPGCWLSRCRSTIL